MSNGLVGQLGQKDGKGWKMVFKRASLPQTIAESLPIYMGLAKSCCRKAAPNFGAGQTFSGSPRSYWNWFSREHSAASRW